MHPPSPLRSPSSLAVVAGLAAGAVLLGPASSAAAFSPTDGREVLGAGVHVDVVHPLVENGALDIKTRTPDGLVEPDSVVVHVPDTETSHVELPAGYEFLGPEGTEAWVTTEVQDPSVAWPGWSFEGIEPGVLQGTVGLAYKGFSYAGESTSPEFAVTQPGGFDGTKVSQVMVPGTSFTSTTGEVGGHTHATWTFTAEGTYDVDLAVNVKLADGTPLTDTATVRFVVGDPVDTAADPVRQVDPDPVDSLEQLTVVPNKVDAEYFVGQTVTLKAMSPDSAETDTYRWWSTPAGSSTPKPDPKQATATWTTKPSRALDGTTVHVERVTADGTVAETSEPLTINSRAIPPTTTLTVTPDKASYALGDTARFKSARSPQTEDEHYHWYLKTRAQESYVWVPESRAADQELAITADMDGAMLTARLFNAEHSVLAESEPIELDVTGAPAPAGTIELSTPSTSYAPGEEATFTAAPSTSGMPVEWSVRKAGENDFTTLESGTEGTLVQPVAADWDGAQVRAVVRDTAGAAMAQSSIPVVRVQTASAGTDVADPQAAEESTSTVGWVLGGAALALFAAAVAVVVVRRRQHATR